MHQADSIFEALANLYEYLSIYYRNEYFFRNEIINNIYWSRHDLSISHMYSEFSVGKSRTDLAIFNGTSTCYEIKTEIDSLRRLEGQISDYIRFFDRVYVAITEERLRDAIDLLPVEVGIIVLTDSGIFESRNAESNIDNIDPVRVFNSLRQAEQISIASNYEPTVLNLGPIEGYFKAKEIFSSLNPHLAHMEFMSAVKSRKSVREDQQFRQLPRFLGGAYVATKMTKSMWTQLIHRLFQSMG
ncbi:sce7726 family protein [Deinococcus caeni]|uniref:sce7726 family protein n=1 Tax=Deinococcus caeni TaxID=569127 RepID=UPI0031EE250C